MISPLVSASFLDIKKADNGNRHFNRSGLSRNAEAEKSNLDLSFNISGLDHFILTPSPLSLHFTLPSVEVSSPFPIFTSSFYDDAYADDSDDEDEDTDAQYICIPESSPFYTPPVPHQSSFPRYTSPQGLKSSVSFTCDALGSFSNSPAALFHKSFGSEQSTASFRIRSGEDFPAQCADVSVADGFDTRSAPTALTVPPVRSAYLPDVPSDLSDDEEIWSETDTPHSYAVSFLPSKPEAEVGKLLRDPNMDRRLVAPFEFESKSFFLPADRRATVVPSHLFCGFLAKL